MPQFRVSEFTGQPVDTSSEAWRHECEVRFVLEMPDRPARQAYVNGVLLQKFSDGTEKWQKGLRQVRGAEAAETMINDIRRLHAIRQQRQQQPAAA